MTEVTVIIAILVFVLFGLACRGLLRMAGQILIRLEAIERELLVVGSQNLGTLS